MGKLNNIDKAAAGKGSGINTLWQFVKFIVVSLGACIVQVASLAILYNIPATKALSTQAFHWFVFDYPVIEGQRCGLALFIAFNVSNLLAQIVAFFINKEKTFNSGSNTAITLPIYIIFTLALVCFSAWFNPVVFEFCTSKFHLNSGLSLTIATAVCSALQFFLFSPWIRFSSTRKRKTRKQNNQK